MEEIDIEVCRRVFNTIFKCKDNELRPKVVPKLRAALKERALSLKMKKEAYVFIKELRKKAQSVKEERVKENKNMTKVGKQAIRLLFLINESHLEETLRTATNEELGTQSWKTNRYRNGTEGTQHMG